MHLSNHRFIGVFAHPSYRAGGKNNKKCHKVFDIWTAHANRWLEYTIYYKWFMTLKSPNFVFFPSSAKISVTLITWNRFWINVVFFFLAYRISRTKYFDMGNLINVCLTHLHFIPNHFVRVDFQEFFQTAFIQETLTSSLSIDWLKMSRFFDAKAFTVEDLLTCMHQITLML